MGFQVTPTWVAGFEEKLRVITDNAYKNLIENQWWDIAAKRTEGESKTERTAWIVETASLETLEDGEMTFEDLAAFQYEYTHEWAGKGLELHRAELEDKDANGINMAVSWNKQIAEWMAYWPQEQLAKKIIANPTAYDGKAYFATDHPLNPLGPASATYSNLLSLPLNTTDVDDALSNMTAALSHIRGKVLTPNGKAPRRLKATHILHPPDMADRITQLTNAKHLAQSKGSSAGSSDVEAIIKKFGTVNPVECAELGTAVNASGSDKDCYIVCEDIAHGELGGFIYSVRQDFEIIFHDMMTDAGLARQDKLQWTVRGRNTVQPGHPFAIFKLLGV